MPENEHCTRLFAQINLQMGRDLTIQIRNWAIGGPSARSAIECIPIAK